jgi:hypothetical protein
MILHISYTKRFLIAGIAILLGSIVSLAQEVRWMNVGSLQSYYSILGSEYESELDPNQELNGWAWPAIIPYQDMIASRGLWIGVNNYNPGTQTVVHMGPRSLGRGEFFPISIKTYGRYDVPQVTVNNKPSYSQYAVVDSVDNSMNVDRMIQIVDHTAIGLTLLKNIKQTSHQLHDNYIVTEYIFTNTGIVDDQGTTRPAQTLNDVCFFFHFRLCICKLVSNIFTEGVGWGSNTMVDARGDGLHNDPPNENFRAQFAWHGKVPSFKRYDNMGGPIWDWSDSYGYVDKSDTIGRLAATQFPGVLTLHADKSATDQSDDVTQPSTTTTEYSDHPLFGVNNDMNNSAECAQEYTMMTRGHSERDAWIVEPSGNFVNPTNDPQRGELSGWQLMNGYGPYTIAPGQSIRIVFAEAAAGISQDTAVAVGRAYKQGLITAAQKNSVVFQGKDSLFQTFRRAIANYNSGYTQGQAVLPPKDFSVNTGIGKITLTWDVFPNASQDSFKIYRAYGKYWGDYSLVQSLGGNARSFEDTLARRGIDCYFYIQAVDHNGMVSNRYLTQTYDPAQLMRAPSISLSEARVVPNPFTLASNANRLRYPQKPDQLGFLNIPANCSIEIFTEYGELIKSIDHSSGTGDEYWNCTTSSNQVIVSGIYIAIIHDKANGQQCIRKFIVIR